MPTPSNGTPDEIPPHKRIHTDLTVEGMLRLGDDYHVEGDVIAPGGVLLGDNVIIDGDLYTDGEVTMGEGCEVRGRILPVSAKRPAAREASPPPTEPSPGSPEAAQRHLAFETVEATLNILWDLILEETPEDLEANGRAPASLEGEAIEDLQAGIRALLDDAYGHDTEAPWDPEDVVSVLFQRILPLVLPLEATRLSAGEATLEIPRPTMLLHGAEPEGWPIRVTSLVALVGRSVLPSLEVEAADEGALEPAADPASLRLRIGFPTG